MTKFLNENNNFILNSSEKISGLQSEINDVNKKLLSKIVETETLINRRPTENSIKVIYNEFCDKIEKKISTKFDGFIEEIKLKEYCEQSKIKQITEKYEENSSLTATLLQNTEEKLKKIPDFSVLKNITMKIEEMSSSFDKNIQLFKEAFNLFETKGVLNNVIVNRKSKIRN